MRKLVTGILIAVFGGLASQTMSQDSASSAGQSADDIAARPGADESQPDCEEWNTEEFFEVAVAETINACLAAGADSSARDESEQYTPALGSEVQ